MSANKREKVQPLGHFFGLALEKNCDFALFSQKIEINRNLVEMLRNFIDTCIKIHIDDLQSFVTLRISVDFFYFFNCEFARFGRKNKKIETYSECYETFHIIYMYFYRGVWKVS